MKIFRLSTTLILFLVLSGCATTQSMVWVNPKLTSGSEGARQEMNDKLLCGQVASGEAPPPQAREFMPLPSGGYTFSGQATTYGSAGQYNSQFSGTAAPAGGGFSRGFASGYNMGIAIRAGIERKRWETSYDDCLHKLGWTQVLASEAVKASDPYFRSLKTPVGAVCKYTGDCDGTAICQKNLCVPRPN